MMAIMNFVTLNGSNITLKESIANPKLGYPIHMYTKEWETTHQLDKSITSSSSVDLWKSAWALYYSYLLSGLQFTTRYM